MNQLKRIAVLAMMFMMVFCLQSVTASAQSIEDMPTGWAKEAAEKAVEQGLLTPYDGKIYPDRALTRAEMAAIVNRLFQAKALGSLNAYTDVPASSWYAQDMARAVQMGAFEGNEGKLSPERSITRQEAFTVISRIFQMPDGKEESLKTFQDASSVADWAASGTASMIDAGYVNGSHGIIRPNADITRAEFAQVMFNIAENILDESGEYTQNYDGNLLITVPEVTLKNSVVTGDLILCDGVAAGDITLDHVTVEGRVVIRGGGKDTVKLIASKIKGDIVVNNVNNPVRLLASEGTVLDTVIAQNQVILDAEVSLLKLSRQSDVTLQSGKIAKLEVLSSAAGSKIAVDTGAVISTVTIDAKETTLQGKGTVAQVQINANQITVNTGGTRVIVGQGLTGVVAGGIAVTGGKTVVIDKSGSGVTVDGTTKSSNGSNHDNKTTPDPIPDPTPDPGPVLSPTAENWVEISKTGIVNVDFVSFATVALRLDFMNSKDLTEYDYYIGGVKLDAEKDVSKVMKSADDSLLVIKMMLPNNVKPQILKLVKGTEYMQIELNDIGYSVKE
ncbi:S-layer homology domain-containing protein [Clostridium aminobutyricum]|uniref:S-layer homology domain-containing protein n=1 Tax=Clostridium aminobutyricum TaxID=33953 RepID=A0A939IGQ0_CLOAM|nr:S-layer homology domain-containing protein [Clostridium aminobutyricum]MBN7772272.1 S-layer homology domain-containing protein [Clostridium aminobutyricum]